MPNPALDLIEAQIESVVADIEALELTIVDVEDTAGDPDAANALRRLQAAYRDLLDTLKATRATLQPITR